MSEDSGLVRLKIEIATTETATDILPLLLDGSRTAVAVKSFSLKLSHAASAEHAHDVENLVHD
jgi:hypothetical protein